MKELHDENIETRSSRSGNETESQSENIPVYGSRLEKYHSKQQKQKKNKISPEYTVPEQKYENNSDLTEPKDTYTSQSIFDSFEEPEPQIKHQRSSKDADLNIQKLIDLDEGYDTNRFSSKKPQKMSKAAKAWLIALCCVGVVICLLLVFVIEIVSIEGQSMEPTLYGGEKIIAEKMSRYFEFPEKGQVVVTTYDGYDGYYVKRIIAYPGEWVEIYDNTVYVNGEALDEPYVDPNVVYDDMALMQVPEGHVFLLGDNRAQSLDSRMDSIGPVDANNLVGNAWCVILPFDKIRSIE